MALMIIFAVCLNDCTSNEPSGLRNFMRFNEAKLHEVSSRNMYSLHGFEALMREVLGQVCHLFIVVSNCSPGSPQIHADSETCLIKSRALQVSPGAPVVKRCVV